MTTPTNTQPTILISPTIVITQNTTFSSTADSVPLAIVIPTVVGGIIGLCIIFICVMGLIIKNRKKQGSIKRGTFTIQSLTSLFNRYVCCNYVCATLRI